ncbi:uncharacterized protein TNCT_382281 [Trichonephila clavata]|uniref:Uncharacterized protein n=1 Tax=Trichonephila clavata TaxID=2740835 RepID=A0A8X6L5F7_TRICU|nr:uncharacterized protein TNCT_382281 [Trichonephila clavata]
MYNYQPGMTWSSHDQDFEEAENFNEPHRLNGAELSDLVRDFDLPKKTKILASRLQQWYLFLPGIKITDYLACENSLFRFFEKEEHVVPCIDINGMMNFMDIKYDPNYWRWFIDSSKLSFKAVLLHNGNLLPSIPIGHSVHVKETYANVKILLELKKYEDYK